MVYINSTHLWAFF